MNYVTLLDIIGTLVFAISGALTAAEHKFDLMGVGIVAFVTALGGGTIRDILIGAHPVGWMQNTNYLLTVLTGVIVVFFLSNRLQPLRRTFFLFDAIGLGVFTIGGLEKALSYGVDPVYAIICGMISASMGGLLRDVLCNEVPLILRKEIYATAGAIGAGVYLLLKQLNFNQEINFIITIVMVIIIRIFSVRFKIRLPGIKLL